VALGPWALLAGLSPAPEVGAQVRRPGGVEGSILGDRPGERPLEAPPPEEPEPLPQFELPPVPEPSEARLSGAPSFVARGFRIVGSTVFSEAELAAVAEPYVGRSVTSEDLQRLRNELTLLYVNRGYVNSGAVLPDQQVEDGIVEYRIVEGELSGIELQGNRWFRNRYLTSRIELAAQRPLDVRRVEGQLQILQQDPRIRRVQAELRPGALPGEGVLGLRVDEEQPFHAALQFDNWESPSIGSYHGSATLSDQNLTGNGDILTLDLGFTDGLDDYEGRYEIPVTPRDTILAFGYRWSKSHVVESPFDELDISSKAQTASIGVRHPVLRSLRSSLWLSLTGEWRESETFLFGEPFPFALGTDDGKSRISVLRFAQDWVYRDRSQVLAARSTVSWGVDVLNPTVNGSGVPDSLFLAWLGQFQWVRRFDPWGIEALFRTEAQLADSPLLSLEQFSVGGHDTVRGYRENELVRDNGLVGSLEIRIPLLSDSAGRPYLQLAPFADIGRSWNASRDGPDDSKPYTLYSVGVGLRFQLTEYFDGEIYWGDALRDVTEPDDHDLQDDGVQFRVTARY
jgi:hemolysin activation/secretion protein